MPRILARWPRSVGFVARKRLRGARLLMIHFEEGRACLLGTRSVTQDNRSSNGQRPGVDALLWRLQEL